MVNLFGTPSRKYAPAAVLDPTYAYPIPLPLELRREDYYASSSVAASERSYSVAGSSQPRRRAPSTIDQRPGTSVVSVSDVGGPSRSNTVKKKKKKKVVIEGNVPEPVPYNPMRMTGGHVRGVNLLAVSRQSVKPSSDNVRLQQTMKTFSAVDLAPPAPRSKKGSVLGKAGKSRSPQEAPSLTNNSVFATESSSSSVVDPRRPVPQDSVAQSTYGNGYQTLRFEADGALTPPLSDPGRRDGRNSSYDAYSPWSVEAPSKSSSSSSLARQAREPHHRPSTPHIIHSTSSSKSSSESGQTQDPPRRPPRLHPVEGLVVREKSPLREQPVMSRSLSEAVSEMGPSDEEEGEGSRTGNPTLGSPGAPVASGSLAPPSFALQPPTPQHDLEHTPFHNEDSPTLHIASQSDPMPNADPSMLRGNFPTSGSGHSLAESDSPEASETASSSMPPTPERSYARSQTAVGPAHASRRYSCQVAERLEPQRAVVPPPRSRTTSFDGQSLGVKPQLSPRPSSSGSWRGPVNPPISVPFLPANPQQPSYLRWDPATQRWQPVNGQPPVESVSRARSVASSMSVYSQNSSPPAQSRPPDVHSIRRASAILPPLLTSSLGQYSSRAPSPAPSQGYPSRPSSPAGSRSNSGTPTMGSSSGFPNRRMSIDPPYSLSPTMLTFLPEMMEHPDQPRALSRSNSRQSSYRDGPYGAVNDMARNRNSLNFPSGYDAQARAFALATETELPYSDNGDTISQAPESQWNGGGSQRSRPGSMYAGSQYGGGSQFGGGSVGGRGGEKQVKAGRESALDTMSKRGEPVPLLGADGLGDEGRGGYTNMILPSGAYNPVSDPTKTSSKIDARVLGMPTSTMSTVTLSGSASHVRRGSSISFRRPEAPTPAHLLGDSPAPLAFSSHQAPPSKVSPSQVLVQVYTVALDKWDSELVREKSSAGSGVGKWVPGRAFCGRALDVGADVRTILKGDLVMGMVDIKKSGTLAEFITCDRRRIARIPQGTDLSLEQLSCLPLLGIPAHRACCNLPRGSRALVLNAHEGIGSLVAQELSVAGVHVTAHCPLDVEGAEEDCWDNGAEEVRVMGVNECLNHEHESGFDLVLDTVGGRAVYDGARRILRSAGIYVTLFGNGVAVAPKTGPQLKQSLHSLRRAFIKKDKKQISYIHINPSGGGPGGDVDPFGQDSRDILEMAVMAIYRPKVGVVVPFERAADGFEELERQGRRGDSGTVVVRLSN